MAKRQTTGMPKRQRQADEVEAPSRIDGLLGNPRTRAEREAALNQLIIRGTIFISALVVFLIIGALAWQYLIVPNRTVVEVNGDRVTVAEFRDRIALEQGLIVQRFNARVSEIQQQAAMFGMDANQFLQQDPQIQQWQQELQFPDLLGQRLIDEIINDLLIEQEAEERNITINDEAVDSARNDLFGYDPTAVALIGADPTETPLPSETPIPFVSPTPSNTPQPTPTLVPTEIVVTEEVEVVTTEEASDEPIVAATIPPSPTPNAEEVTQRFNERVDEFRTTLRTETGIGNTEIDAFFRRVALQEALREELFGEQEVVYVNSRHILVETEEEALDLIERLNNGTSFVELARAYSLDNDNGQGGSAARGGELGWSPVSGYVPAFGAAAETAEIGEIVGPVETDFGYHIIQVRAREIREVDGAERDGILNAEFQKWLEEQREANEDNISINNNWVDYVN